MLIAAKKIICNKDYDYVLNKGVLHLSPFIFKTLFSILYNYNLNKMTRQYIDSYILNGFEAGIPLKALSKVEDSGYGYLNNPNTGYKDCIKINFPRTILDSEYLIKFKNTLILLSVHFILASIILFGFIINWLFACLTFLKNSLKNPKKLVSTSLF